MKTSRGTGGEAVGSGRPGRDHGPPGSTRVRRAGRAEQAPGARRERSKLSQRWRLVQARIELLALAPSDARTLDVPVFAVVGALRRIVSRHLRNFAEDELPARLDDGLAWLYSYARAPGAERWCTSQRARTLRPLVVSGSPGLAGK